MAPWNIPLIFKTPEVFHVFPAVVVTGVAEVAPQNILDISVTKCVSHDETSGFAEVAP